VTFCYSFPPFLSQQSAPAAFLPPTTFPPEIFSEIVALPDSILPSDLPLKAGDVSLTLFRGEFRPPLLGVFSPADDVPAMSSSEGLIFTPPPFIMFFVRVSVFSKIVLPTVDSFRLRSTPKPD